MKFIGAHIFDYDATFRGDVTIEGNLTVSNSVSQTISFGDNDSLYFGNGNDLQIVHDGANSKIENSTGQLTILNTSDDKDIVFRTDDGGGGVTDYIRIDGGDTITKFSKNVNFGDSVRATFGASNDMQIHHDGSNNYIETNNAGHLYIQQNHADHDIVFQSDDGSGGTTAYLTLDGSAGYTTVQKHMVFADSASVYLGTGADLQLVHDGSNSTIQNNVGNLTIRQDADDGDMKFQCDDGAGGVAEYFRLDGSLATHDGSSTLTMYTKWPDNSIISLGTGNDIRIYHNGTNSYLDNLSGDYYIRQKANDKDLILQCDDGSGGNAAYITLDGGLGFIVADKKIRYKDNVEANFGDSGDARIYHSGSSTLFDNFTGNLAFTQNADGSDIIFNCDDGSGGTAEYFRLDGGLTTLEFAKGAVFNTGSYVKLWDSVTAFFGTGNDLRIHHNGSNSFISQEGTGDLYIRNTIDDRDIYFQSDDGSGGNATYFYLDGSETLVKFSKHIRIPNLGQLYGDGTGDIYIGNTNSGILRIGGDGTDTVIQPSFNNLVIKTTRDIDDIVFKAGASEDTYITLDSGDSDIKVHKNFEIEKTLTMQHTADPSDPATGHSVMWSDTSGNLKIKINVGGSVVTRTLATGSD